MNFYQCLDIVLRSEGGYSFHVEDNGGETKFGISKKAYPHLDIATLTREDASIIYKRDYWDVIKAERMPAQIRLALFDCAVNQGNRFAITTLQKIVGEKPDGVCGPMTINAVIKFPSHAKLLERFLSDRLKHYASLSDWKTFGHGWARRLLEIAVHSA